MNFYEELGLDPLASHEEIRKAHRVLSRLVHPDFQTEAGLRDSAEWQMRRLNQIFEVLLDPRKRAAYDSDQGITAVTRGVGGIEWRTGLTFSFLVAAGVVLALSLVWWFAGDSIRFQGAEPEKASTENKKEGVNRVAVSKLLERREVVGSTTSQTGPMPVPASTPAGVTDVEGRTEAVVRTREVQRSLEEEEPAGVQEAPDVKPEVRQPSKNADPLAGTWVYSATAIKAEKTPIAMYAPVFIQLEIKSENPSVLRGSYHSRYRVPDRPISSEVAFEFAGPMDGASTLEWRAADGSRGVVKLSLKEPQVLEVDWRVTEFGSRIGLGAGTALLVRRPRE